VRQSPLYSVGEVAALLGVSPHTVRAWETRHGIVKPVRTASGQRRYRSEDVELLRDIKRAVDRERVSLRVALQMVSGTQVIERRIRSESAGRSRQLPKRYGIWRGVVDVLPHLVVLLDTDGKIVEVNIHAARQFGVTRERLRGRLFVDLVDPFDRAKAVLMLRPEPRAVDGWELNLSTPAGPRLYSFRSWIVGGGGDARLALVGSNVLEPPVAGKDALIAHALGAQAYHAGSDGEPADALQALCDQLPFGVAVATIGRDPRIVYANLQLAKIIGVAPRVFTGLPVSDLLPQTDLMKVLRASVSKQATQALASEVQAGLRRPGRRYDISCQPLTSSTGRVAAVLIVVDRSAAVADRSPQRSLSALDPAFDDATTPRELANRAAQHVSNMLIDMTLAIAVAGRDGRSRGPSIGYSRAAAAAFRSSPALARSIDRIIRSARLAGPPSEAKLPGTSRRYPMVALFPFSRTQPLGLVAWLPSSKGAAAAQDRIFVEALAARLRVASELLDARAEVERVAERLKAMVAVAAVTNDARSVKARGADFLAQVIRVVKADAAAIGRIEGGDFVVEAAYLASGPHAKVGDRFPLSGQFVSTSLQNKGPAQTTQPGSRRLPSSINRALSPMKRALSVPIMYMGQITHVITILRRDDRPFADDDVRLIQALSGTALLAIGATR
jgi:PAS domain-containing protein